MRPRVLLADDHVAVLKATTALWSPSSRELWKSPCDNPTTGKAMRRCNLSPGWPTATISPNVSIGQGHRGNVSHRGGARETGTSAH